MREVREATWELENAVQLLASELAITRPIFFFDTETTGPNPTTDRICQMHFTEVRPDGTRRDWSSLINPTIPIPKEASFGEGGKYEGHGITDDMVKDAPTFASLAPSFEQGFRNCDYGGFNVKGYDLPLMVAEFARVGIQWSYADARILDGYRLWQVAQGRTLTDAVRAFLDEDHAGAHGASADVYASLRVVVAQLFKFNALPRDLGQLHELCWPRDPNAIDSEGKIIWKDGAATMNFGAKWKGKRLDMVPRRDLEWIANTATGVSAQVKQICKDALTGKYPTKESAA